MSGKTQPNIDYGTKFDYSNTPAYRRKLKREKLKAAKKAGSLALQGPLSLLIIGTLILFSFSLLLFDIYNYK